MLLQYLFIELVSKVSKGGFRCDSIDTSILKKKVREKFESSKNNLCGMKGLNIFKNVPKSELFFKLIYVCVCLRCFQTEL